MERPRAIPTITKRNIVGAALDRFARQYKIVMRSDVYE